ncbi:MAG: DUF692 family multinuclear iron-containing protein [Myxococcota bacterium]
MRPAAGVSWAVHPQFGAAVGPALAAGRVEAVEWTVDAGFGGVPASIGAALDAFGAAGRLYGHAIGYSPLSAGRTDHQRGWLAQLRADPRPYRHLSEHFGWFLGGPFVDGAPLPCPRTRDTVRIGQDNLRRLRDAAGCPVGLENLALATSAADALDQGPFVAELLDAVDGFVHLDLHNLWCQEVNFGLEPEALLARWPLDRVRVMHVSGGSWRAGVRRDTHDDDVPEPVWDRLAAVLPRVPACEVVFVERIATSFDAHRAAESFARDFDHLRAVLGAE